MVKRISILLVVFTLANMFVPVLPVFETAQAIGNMDFRFNRNGTFEGYSDDVKADPSAVRYVTVGWTITEEETNGDPLSAETYGVIMIEGKSEEEGYRMEEYPADAKPGDSIQTFFSVPKTAVDKAMVDAGMESAPDGYTVYINSIFRIVNSPKNAGKLFYRLEDILAAESWSAQTQKNLRDRFDNPATYYSPLHPGDVIIRLENSDSTATTLPPVNIAMAKSQEAFTHTFDATVQHNGKTYELYKSYIEHKQRPGLELFVQTIGDAALYTRSSLMYVGGTNIVGVYREQSQIPDFEAVSMTNLGPVVSGNTVHFRASFRNNGASVPGTQPVKFRITNGSGATVKEYVKNGGMASGSTVTVDFSYAFSSAAQTFTATADPFNEIEETVETNNSISRTFTPAAYLITGDFDILPSDTIEYRDSFTLKPKDFDIPSACTYEYHQYRFEKDGSSWTSPRINGQAAETSYSYSDYPPGLGVGSNQIEIKITVRCGSSGTVVPDGRRENIDGYFAGGQSIRTTVPG